MTDYPAQMVLKTMEEATDNVNDFTNTEAVEYVRDFVTLLQGFIKVPEEYDPSDATVLAYTSLLASAMFQEAFIKAYKHASNHLDNVEQLNRMYDQ